MMLARRMYALWGFETPSEAVLVRRKHSSTLGSGRHTCMSKAQAQRRMRSLFGRLSNSPITSGSEGLYSHFLRRLTLPIAVGCIAGALATPAAALDARQAFAFMVATYEQTETACNYADSVRASMERLNTRFSASDPSGWAELKSRGVDALGQLEGIMPLNMEWDSCSSVGGLLADWAPIAAVSLAMEGNDGAGEASGKPDSDPKPQLDTLAEAQADADDIITIINGPSTAYATRADWTITTMDGETQGGCRMATAIDVGTNLIVVKRPGADAQFGIASAKAQMMMSPNIRLAITIDGRALAIATPETNFSSLAWFVGNGRDLAEQIDGGRLLEVALNGYSFRLLVEGFATRHRDLVACAESALRIANPTDLLGRG